MRSGEICDVNLCFLSQKILFWSRWRKKTGQLGFTWKTATKVELLEPDAFRPGCLTVLRIIEFGCY